MLPSIETVLDVSAWEAPKGPVEVRRILARKADPISPECATFWVGADVRPSDLYCYLKARFGAPNGFLSFLRSQSSDNLIHWHYYVVIGEGSLEAMSTNRGTEFRIIAERRLEDSEKDELIARIKQDFGRIHAEMGAARAALESWTVFVNPFRRVADLVLELYDELVDLEATVPAEPRWPSEVMPDQEDVERFVEVYKSWANNAGKRQQVATKLDLLLPIMGEAFVNLLLFVLAKPEIRGDERVYGARVRDQIDVRVRSLHHNCNGFNQAIDPTSEVFGAFHSMMNRRNDLLHGNVDPRNNIIDHVYFDGWYPIFPYGEPHMNRVIRRAVEESDPGAVIERAEWLSVFILYVLDCLDGDARMKMHELLLDAYPGWREDFGRVGVLFPSRIVVGLPGAVIGEPPPD